MKEHPLPCDALLSKEEIEIVDDVHNKIAGFLLSTKSYPLELLAATASRLLEGDDYEGAVTRAVRLLKTCEKFQDVASHNKAWLEESAKQNRALVAESRTSKHIPFSSALEKIYARSRHNRNLDAHRAFIGYRFKETGDYRYSAKFIDEDADRGFLPSEVERLRGEFQAIPSGKWRTIMVEYNRQNAPTEKKCLVGSKKASTGKKRPPAGKVSKAARKAKK